MSCVSEYKNRLWNGTEMRNLENKLKNRKINHKLLEEYGFKKEIDKYIYQTKMQKGQFEIEVVISNKESYARLVDLENEEEFVLVDIEASTGQFVGQLRKEYENVIENIIQKCTSKCGWIEKSLSQRVYEYLTKIPKGKVVTYKQVAESLGNKGLARAVGNILHKNPDEHKYPCYKVLNSKGELADAFVFGGKNIQKKRLEKEGIKVIDDKVDLSLYQWKE